MSPLKIGLIGLGNMGKNHLRVLSMLKDVELGFIYDIDKAREENYSNEYGIQRVAELAQGLDMVEAAVIVTPTKTHFDYVREVGDKISNIFIEKPLADTLVECDSILAMTKSGKVKIQVGFIERFNPAVIALKQVINKNAHEIINIDFIRTNKVSSRITDVDVVSDLMIHDIDLALYLNGPAASVSAYGVVQNNQISYARAAVEHVSGAFSNLTASRITDKRIRSISVTSNDRYIDCNLLRKEVLVNKQSVEKYYEDLSITSVEETIDVRPQEALLLELVAFVQYVREEKVSVPDAQDGYNAAAVADRVKECIYKGKED